MPEIMPNGRWPASGHGITDGFSGKDRKSKEVPMWSEQANATSSARSIAWISLAVFTALVWPRAAWSAGAEEVATDNTQVDQKQERTKNATSAEPQVGQQPGDADGTASAKAPPATGPRRSDDKKKQVITGWIGYGFYSMGDFNAKLSGENNTTIKGGLNAGVEYTPGEITLPLPNTLKDVPAIKIPVPIGFEYLDARSKTTHTDALGAVTTVNWELPVLGIYVAPEIPIPLSDGSSGWRVKWRPIGIGYYMVGRLLEARLSVSDRSGELDMTGDAVGLTTQLGIKYLMDDFELFVEGGYRWLRFSDVKQEPKDGFDPHSPSILPETLDYSGPVIKAGVCLRF
jgi:hypothetical protein